MTPVELERRLAQFPRERLAHVPTPVEPLPRLGAAHGVDLWVKRDDCTGFALGGNKARQLEFYMGAAVAAGADSILITSAAQSNFMRSAAAAARKLGMTPYLQREDRVPNRTEAYRRNGNLLLDEILGAEFADYPEGEDEAGADAAVAAWAERLKADGRTPYAIPLSAAHPPTGALGYVAAAIELARQMDEAGSFDRIVVASGSALTHTGILVGLRALGRETRVLGACVRRDAATQAARVLKRSQDLEAMLGLQNVVAESDVDLIDPALAPGYGRLNPEVLDAIRKTARLEGLFLDPVYTGKVMASLLHAAARGAFAGERVLFWHTGGQPALFAYADDLQN